MQGFRQCAGMLRTNMVVRAGKDLVFETLTEPRRLRQWLCEGASVDLPSGSFELWGRGLPGAPGQWAGATELLASREPELLLFRQMYAGVELELEFILSSTIGGLNIGFSIRGLDPLPKAERISIIEGWSAALLRLRSQLELARVLGPLQASGAAGQTIMRSV